MNILYQNTIKNTKKKKIPVIRMNNFHVFPCTTVIFFKSNAESFDVSVDAWKRQFGAGMVKYCKILKKSKFIIFHFNVEKRPNTLIRMNMTDMVITTLKQLLKDCDIGWNVATVHTTNFESIYLFIKTNKIHSIKYTQIVETCRGGVFATYMYLISCNFLFWKKDTSGNVVSYLFCLNSSWLWEYYY
jgi:hypothetical protein